jgi:hypothetical protein
MASRKRERDNDEENVADNAMALRAEEDVDDRKKRVRRGDAKRGEDDDDEKEFKFRTRATKTPATFWATHPRRKVGGADLIRDAEKLVPVLQTFAEYKKFALGYARGDSIISGKKRKGNISMDPDFALPPAYGFSKEGKRTPPDAGLLSFLRTMTREGNLAIIEHETNYMISKRGGVTSPSLHAAIEIMWQHIPREGKSKHVIEKCSTSTACLSDMLKKLMNPLNIPGAAIAGKPKTSATANTVVEALRPYLELLQVLYKSMFKHNVTNERTNFSRIRTNIIKVNFGSFFSEALKTTGIFEQSRTNKVLANRVSEKKQRNRVVNQTSIDFKAALLLGQNLVKVSRKYTGRGEEKKDTSAPAATRINTLISTVMYCIGSRQTEVIILSDYRQFSPDQPSLSTISNNIISKSAPLITINPVAKDRSAADIAAKLFHQNEGDEIDGKEVFDSDKKIKEYGITEKTSDRVILFGATVEDIRAFVAEARRLLAAENPEYKSLDKKKKEDRVAALRMIPISFNSLLNQRMKRLNPAKKFTARSLRGLYVILSYRLWAKQPTSEIMWINTILAHKHISTSVSYNVYSLSQVLSTLDEESVRGLIARQNATVDEMKSKLESLETDFREYKLKTPPAAVKAERERETGEVEVKTIDGGVTMYPKQPHTRSGTAAKVALLTNVVEDFFRKGIKTNTMNYRAVGFSAKTIKAWKAEGIPPLE